MTRKVFKLAAATLLAALFMVSCENPIYDGIIADIKDPVYYTITFVTDSDTAIPPQSILSGGVATRPENPIKDESTFMDWYTENSYENVYDFSAKVTGNITLYAEWQYGTETAPMAESAGSSSIKISWTPPSNVYYALIYRYSTETNKYRQIGEVKAADGTSYLPAQCVFYDYFADSDYKYSYFVKSANYDTASADWITHITLDSEMIQGRASSGIPTVSDSYTLSYNGTYGILSFSPAIQTYLNHAQAGTFTTHMIMGDGTTDQTFDSTTSFSWANLTQLAFSSNFKTDGVELNAKLKAAYVKSDSATGLKSITYLNTDGLKLNGKTTGIIIPSYKTSAVIFDANGGTGSMNIGFGKVNTAYPLLPCTFNRAGYLFVGWSKSPAATTADYTDGCAFTIEETDTTLYAVWKLGGAISLNYTNTSVQIRSTLLLTATISNTGVNKSYAWTTSDPTIATVNASGMVTGINAGTATISVINGDGTYSGSCIVTVTPLPKLALGTSYTKSAYGSSWYQIDTVAGQTYNINWRDSKYNSLYSAYIDLCPFADSQGNVGLWDGYYQANSGYIANKTFTATGTTTYLEIRPNSNYSGNTGNYRITVTAK